MYVCVCVCVFSNSLVLEVAPFIYLFYFISYKKFWKDLKIGEWTKNAQTGKMERLMTYVLALTNPLGPKTAPTIEKQVRMNKVCRVSVRLFVDWLVCLCVLSFPRFLIFEFHLSE